jgi:hypothetical protein
LPREFSQYLRVANGSLMETSNHLRDGYDRGYFTKAEIEPLLILARRASAALTRLLRYLRTVPPNGPSPRTRTVKRQRRTVEPKNPEPRNPKPENPQPENPNPRTPNPRTPNPRTPNPRTPNPRTAEPKNPRTGTRAPEHS